MSNKITFPEELEKDNLLKAHSMIVNCHEYTELCRLCTCKPSMACMYSACVAGVMAVYSSNQLRQRAESKGLDSCRAEICKAGMRYLTNACYKEEWYADYMKGDTNG